MKTKPLFSIPAPTSEERVAIFFEERELMVPAGINVAAALLSSGITEFRTSVVSGAPRAPYCMMGVCFECLVEIDGAPAKQACMVTVKEGLHIRRQKGAVDIQPLEDEADL